MPAFANHRDYLGIPFADEDRGREGLHCYALARLVIREQTGVDIGDYGPAKARHENAEAIARGRSTGPFVEVSNRPLRAFDLIVYEVGRIDDHVAIAVDGGWMLHVLKGDISRLDPICDPMFGRVSGVYRHEALA
ncbi:NlpC/P60 family protein [Methylopila sp. M107]|uniref:NlpC/P60 family protein n=1 Tax=Methylopila sp. M107 TaxID=1101190 RepID=UPI00036985E9|nr:NlpC/P60 family protein [Methylopila sp. M107]